MSGSVKRNFLRFFFHHRSFVLAPELLPLLPTICIRPRPFFLLFHSTMYYIIEVAVSAFSTESTASYIILSLLLCEAAFRRLA